MSRFAFIGASGTVVPLDPRDELGEPVDDETAQIVAMDFAITSELPVVVQNAAGDWEPLQPR